MEMLDWLTLAIFFVLGFGLGWRLSGRFHIHLLKQLLNDLGVTNQQLIKVAKDSAKLLGPEYEQQIQDIEAQSKGIDNLEQIEIKVEKHGEMLYAFRNDNDAFLGQGSTKDQLIEAMSHRMKNVRLTVVEGDQYMKAEA